MNKNYFKIKTKESLLAHLEFDETCNRVKFDDNYLCCYHVYENGDQILLGMIPHNEILFIKNKIINEE